MSCYAAPFLAGIVGESADIIFCRLIFPCLWTVLIKPDRILFQTLFCCQEFSLLSAVESSPYFVGISLRLHPDIKTQMIAPLVILLSSSLGLPVLAGFGMCGFIMPHCLFVSQFLKLHEN